MKNLSCTTNIGILALMDSESLKYVTPKNFANYRTMAQIMDKGQAVMFDTGDVGGFNTRVYVNPDEKDLASEIKFAVMDKYNFKFIATSNNITFGSPECLLHKEGEEPTTEVYNIEGIEPGIYSVDIFDVVNYDHDEFDKNAGENITGFVIIVKSVDDNQEFEMIYDIPTMA